MSDTSQGGGWWIASDSKWYPPEAHPDYRAPAPHQEIPVFKHFHDGQYPVEALLESAPDAMVIVDGTGTIVLINAQTERLFGYEREELLGQRVEVLVPERFREHHGAYREGYSEDPHTRSMGAGLELYGRRNDGTEFPVEISLSPLETDGRLLVSAAVRDITDRKQAEVTIHQAAAIVEFSHDAIISKDLSGCVTSWNPGAERLYGYSASEMIGSSIGILIPADHDDELIGILERIGRGESILTMESVRMRKDRTLLDVSLTISAIRDWTGHIVGASSVARDITDRKRAEDQFRGLLESAPDAMVIVDGTGQIVLINAQTERLFGYPRTELVGERVEILVPDGFKGRHPAHRDGYVAEPHVRGMGAGLELHGRCKNGTEFPIEISLSPLQTDDGLLVSAAVRDVTDRKKQEQVLADERRRLRSAQTIGRIGSWERDLRTNTLTWSETMFDLYGVHQDGSPAAHHEGLKTCTHPDDRERVDSAMTACIEMGPPLCVRYRLTRPNDGQLRWFEVRGELISENGRPVRIEGTVADVTEEIIAAQEVEEARDMALEASRQKSAFLATMSHEIRTPMNAVIGMTGLLLDTPLDHDQREFVETVRTSGDSLLCIINDILDFSKIEAGGLELEQQPFDLRTCVEESLEVVAATSNAKGLELVGYIDAVCPSRVIGDVTRLRQVLVNLLGNAIKFTAQGEVVLSVEPDESPLGGLRFAVTDTGIGIPPDRVASLFDSFSQVDASTTRVYGGTGLGLAISKRLVEAMGGTLGVDSVPSASSSFHFSVPLPSAPPLTEISGPPQATTLNGRSVLVVDDNPTSRRILRLQLESWGAKVIEADSGNAAITLVNSGAQFDAAVVDMKMPGMTGQELAVWLHSSVAARQVPILLLSSPMDRPTIQPDDLFSSVLTKPVRSARLRHGLRNALSPDGMSSAPSELPEVSTRTDRDALRVLLAEDNAVNQRLGRLMLEKLGHRVDTVANGREAIEAVQRVPYDVVLMDVEMPEMDGLEATRAIRRQLPAHRQPQIVAMTAGALVEDRRACTDAGMDDYMAKPVRLESLDTTLIRAAAARNESAMIPPGQITESDGDPNGARTIRTAAINANVIDTLVDELGDGGTTIVADLIVSYLGDIDEQLAAIHAANANHDLQIVGSVAHKMKSSTALLGADTFAGLLDDICVTARDSGVGLDHLIELLDGEQIRVVSGMTETLHRLTPTLH